MTYNLHPIFVHFPIAFLFIYSIIKVLPFDKYFPSFSWKQIQIVLLTVGVLGAIAAASTGDVAEHLTRPNRDLVHMHENFAGLTQWLYGLLLAGEVLSIFLVKYTKPINPKLKNILLYIEKILTDKTFSKILAVLGFVAVFITGLLGGAMVYGSSADPLVPIVFKILNLPL